MGSANSTAAANPSRAKWLTMIAACVGLMMLYIDLFIVNVALPSIARDLGASLGAVSWTISGYVLMIAVLPMGLGRLGDIWGQRRLYLGGLVLFVVASLACAAAPTIGALIAARVLQGIGAAIMTPATLTITTRAFPTSERGMAIGIYGGVAGVGLVAGPVLGGLLVHGDNWRGIFLINGPVGLAAIVLALLFVPEARDENAPPAVDWWGLALLSFGLGGLMLALTLITSRPWYSPAVWGSVVAGVALLAAFVAVEARVRWPLIDLAIFRNGPFVLTALSFFLFSAALFGSQPYWSLFMQNYWGFTPLQGGLAFVPATATIAILTPLTGIIAQRAGTKLRFYAAAGVFALGVGGGYVALIGPTSTYVSGLLPALLVRGIGIPLFSTCATLALLSAVPQGQAGLASGTLGMARNIGTAFGVATLGVIFNRQIATTLPAQLGDLPAAERAKIAADAANFSATGVGQAHEIAAAAILHGFATLGVITAVFCALATVAVLSLKPSPAPQETDPVAENPSHTTPLIAATED
jgi:DHA2 family methylenomycin A resistance protein-like MFS transporter